MAKASETRTKVEPEMCSADTGNPNALSSIEWTAAEERRLVRKIDIIIMPLLILGFIALQLDRGNISSALTDNFLSEVGITQNQFNVGQQLLLAGIVLLELPSNLILYRLGPRIWLTAQIVAWGLVATFQAFQKGLAAFLVTRILLGLAEGGFIPAGLYSITTWYDQSEISTRFSLFFFGNTLASAVSGLISYGVLQMRGLGGLSGWQWVFIIDGIFTILIGVLFAAFFPKSPLDPSSLIGIQYFNEHEREILMARSWKNGSAEKKQRHISMQDFVGAVTNWTIYPHLLMALTALAPVGTLSAYAPTIIRSFGFDRLKSNAMASVGPWIQLFVLMVFGRLADITRRRGFVVLLGITLWWAFALGCRLLVPSKSKGTRYALVTLAMSVMGSWHPINGSWLALNSGSDINRSITMAMFIMSSNVGGIIGGQIFRSEDAPLYMTGWGVLLGLVSAGLVICVLLNVLYRVLNLRITRKHVIGTGDDEYMQASQEESVEATGKYLL